MKNLFKTNFFTADVSLLVLMILVSAPQYPLLPAWTLLTLLVLIFWRLLIISKKLGTPNRYLSAFITLSLSVITYKYNGGISGIAAGSHLLIIMAFCKVLECKTHRDNMLLVVLAFFIMATNFFFSQSIGTAFYMFFCLYVAIITLLQINQGSAKLSFRKRSSYATRIILYTLPIMIIVFVFFPRISGPLWSTNNDQKQAKTGFSDSMSPGQISDLVYSNELAFRASFIKIQPDNNQLYWRGLVLWHYDGVTWRQGQHNEAQNISVSVRPPQYEYDITLEPHQKNWLFLLDTPYVISKPYYIRSDFTAQSKTKIDKLQQYSASSSPNVSTNQILSEGSRNLSLMLPKLNPQAKQLAMAWKNNSQDASEIVDKARLFFAKENFFYTISPPALNKINSIDQFLFETRRGFCEHYASAFAVLMRYAGIPSRIVLGYLGGEYNPINKQYSIDQSMAHAWTEVWLDGKGWTRVDPTASIAPERVEKNLASALKDQANLPFHLQIDSAVLDSIRQLFDAVDSKWNQWIINYNETNQKHFLESLIGSTLNLKQITYLFIQILLVSLAIISLLYFLNTKRQTGDPLNKAYNKLCRHFNRHGLTKKAHEGPLDFSQRVAAYFPDQQSAIDEVFNDYITMKYAVNLNVDKHANTESIKQFIAKTNALAKKLN